MLSLALLHVLIIAVTNITVQFPFMFLGIHSTWGVFTYPLIFIITDLTVRLKDETTARRTVLLAMFPGLLMSYFMANFYSDSASITLFSWNELAFRVAFASFSAYILGQWLDIYIFQSLRNHQTWWIAPTASSLAGNTLDTIWFFAAAFYHSSHPFFAAHWIEIALVDLGFKLCISLLSFIPLYGVVLQWLKPKEYRIGTEHNITIF
ncbi:queuosine precursor transporter [Legionella londiniensis]|uniref:Queuosine precursor transporter n=1 Tax=Legionella londiniensis TaxID=45068 RepID=A0A0W0VR65_9GAMM|nr:queuosine precursor transporter [Legionella londiniensis]KTD22533.1 membrane protein [Legionella londiniensis]STX92464.1 membrane protein [Legionella londiniensis]